MTDGDQALVMQVAVVSLFPDMVRDAAKYGVTGRAMDRGLVSLDCVNPRDFTHDVHNTVDDRPYGGGPGMVLKMEPVSAAIQAAQSAAAENGKDERPVVFLTPQGRMFDQQLASELAASAGMILVAGRYEGFDERLLETQADLEVSLGDFVLSGGEVAALAVIDAVVRLLPGVLGDDASAQQDSFSSGLLDYPHYTRSESIGSQNIPPILLSGDHAAIERWRTKEALGRTWVRRPDLLKLRELSSVEQDLLQEYIAEYNAR